MSKQPNGHALERLRTDLKLLQAELTSLRADQEASMAETLQHRRMLTDAMIALETGLTYSPAPWTDSMKKLWAEKYAKAPGLT